MTLLFLLFSRGNISALTITGNFTGGRPSGPTFGGGNLVDIFEAAARVWEHAIKDDYTVVFDYSWGPQAPGVFGSSHTLLDQRGKPNRETHGRLTFDNEVRDAGPDFWPLFLDPSPSANEEFPYFTEDSLDLGGGEINFIRLFSTPGFDFKDLFTIVLHEMGHGLGLSRANNNFIAETVDGNITIKKPLPFSGTVVPVIAEHLDLYPPGTLMGRNGIPFNCRLLPSEVDILVMAQLSGFRKFNLELQTETERVAIDIKPGSLSNTINLRSTRRIAVAILSTPSFDAPKVVDRTSLTFGRTGDEASLERKPSVVDVNGDGLLDLVGQFSLRLAGFELGDQTGILQGQTTDGIRIIGSDSLRIVTPRSKPKTLHKPTGER